MRLDTQNEVVPQCPSCGGQQWERLRAETERWMIPPPASICVCDRCRLRVVLPQPSVQENASRFEDEAYYSHAVGSKPAFFKTRVQLLQAITPGRRLLDVGCALGDMLVVARDAGFQVRGLESSHYASVRAREQYGLAVDQLPIAQVLSDSYDIVHANHVLEHVHNPLEFARHLLRILVPNGVLVVEVPNEFMSLMATLNTFMGRPRRRRIPSIHLFFFEPRTIANVLRRAGFQSVEVSTWTPRLSVDCGAEGILRNGVRFVADLTSTGQNILCIARRS